MGHLRWKREHHGGQGRGAESNQSPTKPEASQWLRGDPSDQADSDDTAAICGLWSGTIGRSGG
jgi:hypothetical protein